MLEQITDFESKVFTLGPARFTVLTPTCIRMEYSKAECFEDEPTRFATREYTVAERHVSDPADKELAIDTGLLKLRFTPDGKHRFNENNLRIQLPNGKTWRPGMENKGNLGGTCKTLDNFQGEGKVGPGLLSRDGWFFIDDAPRFRGMPAGHVLKDVCIELPCARALEVIESSVPVKSQDSEDGVNRIRLATTPIREEISVVFRATIQDNASLAYAAFKRRAEALLSSPAEASSWGDLSFDEHSENVQAVLNQIIGKEPVPCTNPIEVGAPFSDPDW